VVTERRSPGARDVGQISPNTPATHHRQHGHHHNLRARIGCRLLCLAACIDLNHQLGRPSRTLTSYTA
jgi:hypothetical protein